MTVPARGTWVTADQIIGRALRTARSSRPPASIGLGRAWPGVAIALLIFLGHYLYAGIVSDSALALVAGSALLLAAVLVTGPLRAELVETSGLLWPAAPFALVIVIAVFSMTSLAPSAVHPIWAYSGITPGAISIDRSSTQIEIVKLLGMACLFLGGVAVGGSTRRADHLITAVLGLGAVLGAWALLGHVTRSLYATQPSRLEAHFLNPNTAGAFFAVLVTLAAARLPAMLKPGRPRWLGAALVGSGGLLSLVCLLMTQSRGAFIGALVAIAFVVTTTLTSGDSRRRRSAWLACGLALLSISALGFAGDRLLERFLTADQDAMARSAIWAAHFDAFKASPWWGYGLGTSATVNNTLISTANYDTLWNIRSVLNVYLQWLEQAGLVGAAPMFLTLATLLGMTIKGWLRGCRARPLLTGLLAVDIVFLLHGVTDFALEAPSMAFMWAAFLGLQFGLARRKERS